MLHEMRWQIRDTEGWAAPGHREPAGDVWVLGVCGCVFTPASAQVAWCFLQMESWVSERELCVLRLCTAVSIMLDHVCIFKARSVMEPTVYPSSLGISPSNGCGPV